MSICSFVYSIYAFMTFVKHIFYVFCCYGVYAEKFTKKERNKKIKQE